MSLQLSQGFPVAANYPNPTDMGAMPKQWADQVNVKYYLSDPLPVCTNSRWSGLIRKAGDEVIIPVRPDVTWRQGAIGQKSSSENLVSVPTSFKVNKFVEFDFTIADVIRDRSQINWGSEGVTDATKKLGGILATQVFADIPTKADPGNMVTVNLDGSRTLAGKESQAFEIGSYGTPLGLNTKNMLAFTTCFKTILSEQNADEVGKMWMMMPAIFRWKLINSGLYKALDMGDARSVLRTGEVGELDQVRCFTTNALKSLIDPGVAANAATGQTAVASSNRKCFWIVGGNADAISYASWMVTNEQLRSNDVQGDRYRGTTIYDWSVVVPKGLIAAFVYIADET